MDYSSESEAMTLTPIQDLSRIGSQKGVQKGHIITPFYSPF